MIRKLVLAFCATILISIPVFGQTVDELIEKNMTAYAGPDWPARAKALKAMRLTGKIKTGGMEAPVTMLRARPNLIRFDFTVRGKTATAAFDGSVGWSFTPFTGQTKPGRMTDDKTKDLKEDGDFDGPLLDYKAKGNTVELLGKENLQGVPVYKLKVTTKNGTRTIIYLDAGNFLEIREERKRTIDGKETETDTNISDYKDVDGYRVPTRLETPEQAITVETIELNPTLDPQAFSMPEEPAAPPRPASASENPLTTTIATITSGTPANQSGDKKAVVSIKQPSRQPGGVAAPSVSQVPLATRQAEGDRQRGRALAFSNAHQWRSAVNAWQQFIREYSGVNSAADHAAYYNLGVAYESLQNWPRAANAFVQAKFNSNGTLDTNTLLHLGRCYGKLNRWADAAATYASVLKVDPQNEVARRNLPLARQRAPRRQ